MPDIGRWSVIDDKAELYLSTSPYVYALNQPTNAIDPDGNLVIFINGLGGGGSEYWKEYKRVLRHNSNIFNAGSSFSYKKEMVGTFDLDVSLKLNDGHRMYFDGSPMGLGSVFAEDRYEDGYSTGKREAATIIKSLARDSQCNITETIKIITHSMGGVYGKGFVAALKEHIKASKDAQVRKVLITLVADFDSFQAAGEFGEADPNIYTQQFIHAGWTDVAGAGGVANKKEKGADEIINNTKKSSHFISTFSDNISDLKEGHYEWNEKKEEWTCTNCN